MGEVEQEESELRPLVESLKPMRKPVEDFNRLNERLVNVTAALEVVI